LCVTRGEIRTDLELDDLGCREHLVMLIKLDVSHNEISEVERTSGHVSQTGYIPNEHLQFIEAKTGVCSLY